MWEIWTNKLLLKALKSCPKSNKSPNLVTLNVIDTDHWLPKVTSNLPQPCFRSVRVVTSGLIYPKGKNGLFWLFSPFTLSLSLFSTEDKCFLRSWKQLFLSENFFPFALCLQPPVINLQSLFLSKMFTHTYLSIYIHTYHAYIHTYLSTIPTYTPTHLHTRVLFSRPKISLV